MAKNYKNLLKKFGSDTKDIITSPRPKPKRDWFFILSMFFVALFVLTILNSTLFFYWSHTDEPEVVKQSPATGSGVLRGVKIDLRKEKVDHVWEFFKHKEEQLGEIQRRRFIGDPSSTRPELVDESEGSVESEEITEGEDYLIKELP